MKAAKTYLLLLLYFASCGAGIAQAQPVAAPPFGMNGEARFFFDSLLSDIGVRTVRYSGPLAAWDLIEKEQGIYDWSKLDRLIGQTYNSGVRMMLTVKSFNSWDQGVTGPPAGSLLFPKNVEAYRHFLTALAERYDGDGFEDASGSPVVEFFQIENEVDGNFWDDTAEKYGELLIIAYETLKAANPDAKVMIAGVSVAKGFFDFYVPVFDYIDSTNTTEAAPFDIFDLHWYGKADNYDYLGGYPFRGFVASVRTELAGRGWNGNMPIWVSETATYGGKDVVNKKGELLPGQDEKAQAINLVKRYVFYPASGVATVMWFKMMEQHRSDGGIPNDYFENTGLINNPMNSDSLTHKKLAYYTYKFMTDKLKQVDWDSIVTVSEANNIRAYRFSKIETGNPVYVAWWDWFKDSGYNDGDMKIISIEIDGVDSVRVTIAVPTAESGIELNENDYPAFFAADTLPVINGEVTIALSKNPVFVEALYPATSVVNTGFIDSGNFKLLQNHPNPFSQLTIINYELREQGYVELRILDAMGREIKMLADENQQAGNYTITWDGRDDGGETVNGGIYFYQMKTNEYIRTKKMLLLK